MAWSFTEASPFSWLAFVLGKKGRTRPFIHSHSFFCPLCVRVLCCFGVFRLRPGRSSRRGSPLTATDQKPPPLRGWLCPEEWRHQVCGRPTRGSIAQRGCLSLALFLFADFNHPSSLPPPRPLQVRGLGLVPGETSWFLFLPDSAGFAAFTLRIRPLVANLPLATRARADRSVCQAPNLTNLDAHGRPFPLVR